MAPMKNDVEQLVSSKKIEFLKILSPKSDTTLLKSLQQRLSLYNSQKIYTEKGSKG